MKTTSLEITKVWRQTDDAFRIEINNKNIAYVFTTDYPPTLVEVKEANLDKEELREWVKGKREDIIKGSYPIEPKGYISPSTRKKEKDDKPRTRHNMIPIDYKKPTDEQKSLSFVKGRNSNRKVK